MREVGFSHFLKSRGQRFPIVRGTLPEKFRQYKLRIFFPPVVVITSSAAHRERRVINLSG